MRTVLVLSFDLIRADEPSQSLSVAAFTAYARSKESFDQQFDLQLLSFNLVETPRLTVDDAIATITGRFRVSTIDYVAISCYVWSEYLINPLIAALRKEGFRGVIILGGYQVRYSSSPQEHYPDCQVFIKGYAEESFLQALEAGDLNSVVELDLEPDFTALPSPYLLDGIRLSRGQGRVRMESKRGCPYRCAFCAHRDLQRHKVYTHPNRRALHELEHFADLDVRKVNVVDPVFNMGRDYLDLLDALVERRPAFLLSLQTRFENIRGPQGERFLEACGKLNVCLEFGLQTVIEEECTAINRRNDLTQISRVLRALNERGIPYEVSLIYGLPHQTMASFERSVDFLRSHDCPTTKAFPLMLLRGTDLFAQKARWNLREAPIGDYHIPLVVESASFTEPEWHQMRSIADSLVPAERY